MLPRKATRLKLGIQNPWILFTLGLVVGIAIFASYHYFPLRREIKDNFDSKQIASFQPDFEISPEIDHIWGKENADITIVTFNDFTCPYCREQSSALAEFMAENSDKVRVVWRHFPLSLESPLAMSAASAAECAGEQGQFWNYARKLYEKQPSLGPILYYSLADEFKLNRARFEECLESGKYFNRIEAEYNEGISKGVTGTPNNFINGQLLPYALTIGQLKSIVGK